MKKLGHILGNIFTALLMTVAIVMTVVVITSVKSDAGIPNLFGKGFMTVQTDSMKSDRGFDEGDMIIIDVLSEEEANNLKVGDVITFRRYFEGEEYIETHRIIFDEETSLQHPNEMVDGVWVHGGISYYATMGDNTPGIDRLSGSSELDYAHKGVIIGKWTGESIKGLGKVFDFLRSQLGFMLCIVLPVALFFIYELYVFIVTLSQKKKEEALAEVASKEEELKAKAVAEFLAKQQAANSDEDTKPAEPEPPKEEPKVEEPKPADISEEEKARIIAEYMAKQAGEKKD